MIRALALAHEYNTFSHHFIRGLLEGEMPLEITPETKTATLWSVPSVKVDADLSAYQELMELKSWMSYTAFLARLVDEEVETGNSNRLRLATTPRGQAGKASTPSPASPARHGTPVGQSSTPATGTVHEGLRNSCGNAPVRSKITLSDLKNRRYNHRLARRKAMLRLDA